MKSKDEITGSEKQIINAGSEKMSVDTTLTDSEMKQSSKSANMTIKPDVEIAEKKCHESFDNQPLQNNELAVTSDIEKIVKCKKSPKKDKKRKKKSRESLTDSLNGSNLDGISEIRSEPNTVKEEPLKKKHRKMLANADEVSSENNADTGKNEEPHKKKHKDRVVSDNEVSSENNADTGKNEEPHKKKHKDRVVSDNKVSSENNADTGKNEEPHKKKHKDRVVSDNEVSSENNSDTGKNEVPHEKKHNERAVNDNEVSNNSDIEKNEKPLKKKRKKKKKRVVNDNEVSSKNNADTEKNEEPHKKKHKKKRAVNDNNDVSSKNNAEGNILPPVCDPKAINFELADEVMTAKGIGLSDGVDDTPQIRAEANTVKNEEQQKEKHKKRKRDKMRAENDSVLLSENISEGNMCPSVCNLNATTNLELANEVMTGSGISSSKGVDTTSEIRSETSTVGNEEYQKKKDKKRAVNDSENNLGANLYPSVCNSNATTNLELSTEAIVDGGISLSKGADDTPEIGLEANTVENEEPQKKKRKKGKMDKYSTANDSEPLDEKNNSEGKYFPSVCDPNATDLKIAAQNMTADGISSSKVVDNVPEISSVANSVNSENPQKKKRKKKDKNKRKKKNNNKSCMASDSGTLDNNLKENIPPLVEICVSNASINIELADNKSDKASRLVNQQLTANEASSKCANNSHEVDSVSNALGNDGPQKKMEHEETGIDGQDFRDKGLEVKNFEITEDNLLLPAAMGNEIHTPRRFGRRKLLVLDLNGLLCEVIKGFPRTKKPFKKFRRFAVFKRPFCDDFMKFCCENFDIGVWSSRKAENVDGVVNVVMKDFKDDLLFCWSQSECTCTPYKSIENYNKPLVLKKLQKLWNKEEGNLPWELGDYSSSNTLLIDDSPYKALCNPPYTGVFPYAYNYHNERDDALGPGGSLRVYLEGLALAEDVESYVREHTFGKPVITPANPSWSFYEKIINEYK